MNQATRVLLALASGLTLGMGVKASGSSALASIVRLVEPLSGLWINGIRMTVVPLVVSLVIYVVAGSSDVRRVGRLAIRVLPIFFALLILGALLSLGISKLTIGKLEIAPDVAVRLHQEVASDASAETPRIPSLSERIVEMVPANPIRAATDAAMLPLVVFTMALAAALTRLDEDARELLIRFFKALSEAMMVLIHWILALAPIGIFALALALGVRMGASAAGILIHYVAVLAAVLSVYSLLLYPVVCVVCKIPMARFARAAVQAQAIALGSRSSLSALPALVAGARDHLASPPSVTGVVLPFAVSVFRVNVPMAWVVGVSFLARLYGVSLNASQWLGLVATSTILSFSAPGIPSSSLFLLAPVLVSFGIPAEGAAILIAVDAIPDMFKAAANVTSHMAVAALIGHPVSTCGRR
jgi:Na+/H+-dicarboxylate symporter